MDRPLTPAVLLLLLLASWALGPAAPSLSGQVAPSGGMEEEAPDEEDMDEALRDARQAQRRFERDRVRWLPETRDWGGTDCDEILGRMCLRYGEGGDWYPEPEDPRIGEARDELLGVLAAAAERSPADRWILGQRIFYLGEAGRWDEAAALAGGSCDRVGRWCRALQGLALHQLGRYREAEAAFRRALADMDPERVSDWSDPEVLLDAPGRGWWGDLPRERRGAAAALLWAMADPLWLVPGNDRLTEHWARLTVAALRDDARNPYGMSWGFDLEQLLVRYGWEVGWERTAPRSLDLSDRGGVVGHHHPDSRTLMASGRVLREPAGSVPEDWHPDARRPRTAYAPSYAPVVLPGAGTVAVFPRGDRFVVAGVHDLPEDTTHHAGHGHPGRDSVPGPWREAGIESGLFLLPLDRGVGVEPLATTARGSERGALLVHAPAGEYLAGLEVLSPARRRAGRTRLGVRLVANPPDIVTLSDLLLLEDTVAAGAALEETVVRALPLGRLRPGDRVAFAWEVFGLGYRPETLSYRLSIERGDPGFLRRAGAWLGLVRSDAARSLEWEEPGPERPGPRLRSVALEVPDLDPGPWLVRLELRTVGRSPVTMVRRIEIVP